MLNKLQKECQEEYEQLEDYLSMFLAICLANGTNIEHPKELFYLIGFRRDIMGCDTFNRRWHLRKRIYRMLRDILLQAVGSERIYDSGYVSTAISGDIPLTRIIKPQTLALTHRDGTDADGGVWEVMEIDLSPFTLEPSLVDGYFSGYKPKILTIKMFEAGDRPMVNCLFDGVGFF